MKLLNHIVLAAGIFFTSYTPLQAEFSKGVDMNVGYSGITLNTPAEVRNVDVNAVDETTINLQLPESKYFFDVIIGVAPYLAWHRLRLGLELNLHASLNTFETAYGRQGKRKLVSQDWDRWEGKWPKVGAYANIREINLGAVEYAVIKKNRHSISLFGKLNLYDIQIKTFSTKYPDIDVLDPHYDDPTDNYPDKEENSLENSIVQETTVFKDRGLGSRVGIKYRNQTKHGYEWIIDASLLVPISVESVKPNLEIRTGIGAQF